MHCWQWLLLLWAGSTAGLAALLGLVVVVQAALARLPRRRTDTVAAEPVPDVAEPPVTIDLREVPAASEGEPARGSGSAGAGAPDAADRDRTAGNGHPAPRVCTST